MEKLADPGNADLRNQQRTFFTKACKAVSESLAARPFHIRIKLNLAALDCVLVTVGELGSPNKDNLKAQYAALLGDSDFKNAVFYDTSDVAAVRNRFTKAKGIMVG
jgi:hypothetical protein